MGIRVACGCGGAFRVAEQHAGRHTKCPKCGEQLTIPRRQRSSAKVSAQRQTPKPDNERGARQGSPIQNRPSPRDDFAEFLDEALAEPTPTEKKVPPVEQPEPDVLGTLMSRGPDGPRPGGQPDSSTLTGSLTRMVVVTLLILTFEGGGLALGAVVGALFGQSIALLWLAICIGSACALVSLQYIARVAIEAFFESPIHGVLFILLPFYGVYYVASRWEETEALVTMHMLTAGAAMFFAGIMLGMVVELP